jgi:hypothetical protein
MKLIALTLLLVGFGGTNIALYADCDKCCGSHVLEDTGHRYCDEDLEENWCHISECMGSEPCGPCYSIGDRFNDVCSSFHAGEWGMHGCGL